MMNVQSGERSGELERWFLRFNPQSSPRARLFCFPYAGGDANIFRDWAAAMPRGVEVVGVQYPGRGANAGTPAMSDCGQVVAMLHHLIAPLLDVRFAFFGHSNGALVSFELARKLTQERRQRQLHHFLSGRSAAHHPTSLPRLSKLADDELVAELRAIGGTPEHLLQDPRLVSILVPRLRADFALGEDYEFQPGPLLNADFSVLHGAQDQFVDYELSQRWRELTRGQVESHVFDGDHFFIHTRRAEVVKLVADKMDVLLPTASARSEWHD